MAEHSYAWFAVVPVVVAVIMWDMSKINKT